MSGGATVPACRRLPFFTPLLPTLVTGRPHDQQFAPHFGILLVRAGVSSAICCYPMADFCLGIDDLLPVFGTAGHFVILLYEGNNSMPESTFFRKQMGHR
jgi:hypothetical protein